MFSSLSHSEIRALTLHSLSLSLSSSLRYVVPNFHRSKKFCIKIITKFLIDENLELHVHVHVLHCTSIHVYMMHFYYFILSGPGEYEYQEKHKIGMESSGLICSHDTRFKTAPKTPLGPGTYKVVIITNG